ncbi:MAG: acyltransferase domain-containing protein, partial [bacterium]|nr:acyltransferase domain-containing protein [bacterium]
AGVFSLEDALKIVIARGKLMQKTAPGIMLSVPLEREKLEPMLPGELSLAIDNGPSCIVSGPAQTVETFEKQAKEKRLICMRITGDHALHSRVMEPIIEEFLKKISKITLNKPQIPFISNVTGNWAEVNEVTQPRYWADHLRKTVQFAKGVRELVKKRDCIYLEIGPGRDLSALMLRYIRDDYGQHTIHLTRHAGQKEDDIRYLLNKIGQLWIYGRSIDWQTFYQEEKRCRIPLPTYPFETTRFSPDDEALEKGIGKLTTQSREEQNNDMSGWFYLPSWKRAKLLRTQRELPGIETGKQDAHRDNCLVLAGGESLPRLFAARLKQEGYETIVVTAGSEFLNREDGNYMIDPGNNDHYMQLLGQLRMQQKFPTKIIHFWGLEQEKNRENERVRPDQVEKSLDLGFFSMIYMTRAIEKHKTARTVEINVVTAGMQEIAGENVLCPEKATVLGPVKVIPQEHPGISCRSIDVVLPATGSLPEEKLVTQLLEECKEKIDETI